MWLVWLTWRLFISLECLCHVMHLNVCISINLQGSCIGLVILYLKLPLSLFFSAVAIHNREQLASRFFTEGSYWWLCLCVHAGYWEAISSKRDINLLMWWLGVRTSCDKWRMFLVIWFLVNLFIYEKKWDQVFFFNLNLRMTPLQIVRILHLKLL
jgi:hypothetical protein